MWPLAFNRHNQKSGEDSDPMKPLLTTALAACALLGAGCFSSAVLQSYSGAPLPATETCTLRVPSLLELRAIDGVPTDWSLRIKKDPVQLLSLRAGRHRLLVKYYDPTADESRYEVYEAGPFETIFVGDPGSVQELKYETSNSNSELRKTRQKARVWVEQVSPGTPATATHLPPADNSP
jgi:hypothetical protein